VQAAGAASRIGAEERGCGSKKGGRGPAEKKERDMKGGRRGGDEKNGARPRETGNFRGGHGPYSLPAQEGKGES